MDPNACYNELQDALKAGNADGIYHHAESLRNWLDKGGVVPISIFKTRRQLTQYLIDLMIAATSR